MKYFNRTKWNTFSSLERNKNKNCSLRFFDTNVKYPKLVHLKSKYYTASNQVSHYEEKSKSSIRQKIISGILFFRWGFIKSPGTE